MAWGVRKTVTCPSGQEVVLRLFSVLDMVGRGEIPLNLLPSPVHQENGSHQLAEIDSLAKPEILNLMRSVIEASVVTPMIGKDVQWEEIPDADRRFLFKEVILWQREAGGLPTSVGSFPAAG